MTDNQIVGGKCYVGLEFEFSPGAWLGDKLLRFKLSEDPDTLHSITHPHAENHVSFQFNAEDPNICINSRPYESSPQNFDMNNLPRWQKWNETLEKWENATTPPTQHISPRRERYRALMPWQTTTPVQWHSAHDNTLTKLQAHNGSHTLQVNNVQDGSLATLLSFLSGIDLLAIALH